MHLQQIGNVVGFRFPPGCLALLVLGGLFVFFPFFLTDLLVNALGKLGLSPAASILVILGIFFGSLINLPVKRIRRHRVVKVQAVRMFGLGWTLPSRVEHQRYDLIIAINVGGALIPSAMAAYELLRLASFGSPFLPALVCVGINVFVCQRVSRPIPGMGIS